MANEFTMTREQIMLDLEVIKSDLERCSHAIDCKPGYGVGAGIAAVNRLIRLETETQAAMKESMQRFLDNPDGPNAA